MHSFVKDDTIKQKKEILKLKFILNKIYKLIYYYYYIINYIINNIIINI